MYILRPSEGGVWWWLAGDKLEERLRQASDRWSDRRNRPRGAAWVACEVVRQDLRREKEAGKERSLGAGRGDICTR